MQFSPTKTQLIAPAIVRYTMAVVVLWFALQQFTSPSDWFAYIPPGIVTLTGLSQGVIIFLNASFELVFGILLLVGKYTRFVAVLLSLHLFDIMWTLGYGEIAIRDFGLAITLMAVAVYGPDTLSMDTMKMKRIAQPSTMPPVSENEHHAINTNHFN